jgi:hypothetical protein
MANPFCPPPPKTLKASTEMNAWRLTLAVAAALAAAAEAARTAVVLEAAGIRTSHSQFFQLLERTLSLRSMDVNLLLVRKD